MTVGEFFERVYDCAGDALRAAGWYDVGNVDVLYVRPDIERETGREDVRSIHGTARDGTSPDGDDPTAGNIAIWTREGQVAVAVAATERTGALLSLEALEDDLRALVAEGADALAGDGGGVALRGGSDEEIKRCPHCGSRNYEVRSLRPGRPRKSKEKYQCRYCDESFESPVFAESRLAVQQGEE